MFNNISSLSNIRTISFVKADSADKLTDSRELDSSKNDQSNTKPAKGEIPYFTTLRNCHVCR